MSTAAICPADPPPQPPLVVNNRCPRRSLSAPSRISTDQGSAAAFPNLSSLPWPARLHPFGGFGLRDVSCVHSCGVWRDIYGVSLCLRWRHCRCMSAHGGHRVWPGMARFRQFWQIPRLMRCCRFAARFILLFPRFCSSVRVDLGFFSFRRLLVTVWMSNVNSKVLSIDHVGWSANIGQNSTGVDTGKVP